MNRRGFLQSCLALAAAPAIVRADSLMRIVPRDTLVPVSQEWVSPAWVRYTYDSASGNARIYESSDGIIWTPIGDAVATPCGGVVQYQSHTLGNAIITGSVPNVGDLDARIQIDNIHGPCDRIEIPNGFWEPTQR